MMEWVQVFTIAGSTIGVCWYFRSESKDQLKEIRDETKEIRNEIREIRTETKNFHGRLCALEEKYMHMMERFLEKK